MAIYALLVTIVGNNLGFFYHISSGIAANNALIVQVHLDLGKRIDATNARIDGLQYLFTEINTEFGIVKRNDENQDELLEKQVQQDQESLDRLSKLETVQVEVIQ